MDLRGIMVDGNHSIVAVQFQCVFDIVDHIHLVLVVHLIHLP